MVDLVRELSDTHGRKISLVGWSLGGLYARQLAKMMPDRVRSVITLGSPFAGDPKATNAWRVYEMASGRRADRRGRALRRIAVGHAAGADHRDLQPHRRHLRLAGLHGKAVRALARISRSKAAIAAWAIIPPWSTRWPIVSPSPKANGRRSIAAAGAASFIPIRTGKSASAPYFTSPRPCGERSDCEAIRVRGLTASRTCGESPSPRPSPRKSGARAKLASHCYYSKKRAMRWQCRIRLPASSNSSSANLRAPARSSSPYSAMRSCRAAARSGSARCWNSSRRSTSTAAWCARRCRGSLPTAGSSATRSAATVFTVW